MKSRIIPLVLGGGVFICIFVVSLLFHQTVSEWEYRTSDYLFRWRKPLLISPLIVHLNVDDRSIEVIGKWPWKRSIHAHLIDLLSSLGAKAILFDIVFSSPGEKDDDSKLIEATKRAGNVYYPIGFELLAPGKIRGPSTPEEEKRIRVLEKVAPDFPAFKTGSPYITGKGFYPLPELLETAKGVGHISATPDQDGVFRRTPLVVLFEGGYFPSLAFQAAIDLLQVNPESLEIHPGREILLHNAIFPDTPSGQAVRIPIDSKGQVVINYAGRYAETYPHYSIGDLLTVQPEDLEHWRKTLEGNVCLIGLNATGSTDIKPTPIETSFPLNGIHSNILNMILTRNFLTALNWWESFLFLFLAASVTVSSSFLKPLPSALLFFLILVIYFLVSIIAFFWGGFILSVVMPTLLMGGSFVTILIYRLSTEEKEMQRMKEAFSLYVSPNMLRQALQSPHGLSLDGRRMELTMLFSDIVGFSFLADKVEPEEIQRHLNEYFEEMTSTVFEYDGTVDKFMGDGLMVLFGDIGNQIDHAKKAVACAVAMQERIDGLQKVWENQGWPTFQVRIGINTGWVTVGNMGSKRRMSYTVIGREVNLAQRLESAAPPGGILISQRTYSLVKEDVKTEDRGEIMVKGRNEPVKVYTVLEIMGKHI